MKFRDSSVGQSRLLLLTSQPPEVHDCVVYAPGTVEHAAIVEDMTARLHAPRPRVVPTFTRKRARQVRR